MARDRKFKVGNQDIVLEPAPNETSTGELRLVVRDRLSGFVNVDVLFTRNQLFDFVCGLYCEVLEAEPDGVFETSYALDTNQNALGYAENVAELMQRTSMSDPAKAVTNTVAMFRRLEQRLPVLQSCQRALEVCESEFDVNILDTIAGCMQRNVGVQSVFRAATGNAKDKNRETNSIPEIVSEKIADESEAGQSFSGLQIIPGSVVMEMLSVFPTKDRMSVRAWLRADGSVESNIGYVLHNLNLFLACFDDGTLQIRSDIVSPEKDESMCKFSPRLYQDDLEKFCAFTMDAFKSIVEAEQEAVKLGEVPDPPEFLQILIGEKRPESNYH